jgi:hypothetical protein
VRVRKHEFEILEGLPVAEYLLGDPMMSGYGSSFSSGDRALIPHKGSLNEVVHLRKHESSSLLLLRDPIILGARSRTSPYISL